MLLGQGYNTGRRAVIRAEEYGIVMETILRPCLIRAEAEVFINPRGKG